MMEPMDSDCIVEEEIGNDSFKWDTETTRLLLTEYKKNMGKVGRHPELLKKKDLWGLITTELNDRGYNLNVSQVRNRMTTLDRAYKKNTNRQLLNDPALDKELKEIMSSKPYTVFCATMTPDDKQQFLVTEHHSYTDQQLQQSVTLEYDSSFTDNPTDLYKWDFNTTKLLFDMYDEVNEDVELMKQFKTKSSMWNFVTEKLNAHGYIFSSVQVQNRIKTIERAYRRHLKKVKSGKANDITNPFPFENRIKKMIKRNSPSTMASLKFENVLCDDLKTAENDMFEDYDDIANIIVPHVEDKCTTEDSSLLKEIKLLRQEESQFRKEVLKIQKEKISLLQQGNALLGENNSLLRQVVENTRCSGAIQIIKEGEVFEG